MSAAVLSRIDALQTALAHAQEQAEAGRLTDLSGLESGAQEILRAVPAIEPAIRHNAIERLEHALKALETLADTLARLSTAAADDRVSRAARAGRVYDSNGRK